LSGCVLGAAAAGKGSDRYGRHRMLLLSGICFLVSAIGTALASTFTVFILFRIVGGLGIGAASVASPLYIGESAPARWRGRLVALNQLAIVFGMLIVYTVNYRIHLSGTLEWNQTVGWRWMFASGIVPSALLLGLLFVVPETARFLLMQGRRKEAERVAARTGADTFLEILDAEKQEPATTRHIRRALTVGLVLAVLQQVTGINVFLYYAPVIFNHATHSGNASLLATVLLGAVNVVFTILAMALVDRAGRKPLLLAGAAGMALCLVAMGTAIMHQSSSSRLLFVVLAYIACFAFSVGPVTWIVLSEIFPSEFRARAMAISTAVLWIANFVVSQTFPMLDESPTLVARFGHGFPFFLYGGFCVAEIWFVWHSLPETKNRSLEEISSWWSAKDA
jgi:SP family xylose:H+ symportor-like MFS transporter